MENRFDFSDVTQLVCVIIEGIVLHSRESAGVGLHAAINTIHVVKANSRDSS